MRIRVNNSGKVLIPTIATIVGMAALLLGFSAAMAATITCPTSFGIADGTHNTGLANSGDTVDGSCAGLRLDHGASNIQVAIQADRQSDSSLCRTLTNSSGNDYFVPANTATEWNAFLANPPPGVSVGPCSPPPTQTAAASAAPSTPAPTPSSCTADPSVCQLYETYLGREPETAGAVYWDGIIATMQQQGASQAQIQQTLTAGIAGSVEAQADAGIVDQQTFQQASQQSVANAVAFGAANNISNPLATCVTGSANCSSIQMNQLTQPSQQAIAQAGSSLSNSSLAQVTAAYQSILGRSPDVGGLSYWTNQINSGAMTVQQVQQAIASSPEAQARNGK